MVNAVKEVFGTAGSMESVNFQGKTDLLIISESLAPEGIGIREIESSLRDLKMKYFRNLREMLPGHGATLMPGIRELLDKLISTRGVLVGLLTGNFMESAFIKLGRFSLGGYFRFGVYGCDALQRNDMPGIARERIRNDFSIDHDFRDMVIIGDTVYDIECSKKSGARSISVGTGWTGKEILLSQEPDYYFDDLAHTDRVMDAILEGR